METNYYRLTAIGWEGNNTGNLLTHTHKFTRLEFYDYILPIIEEVFKRNDVNNFSQAIPHVEQELVKSHQFNIVEEIEIPFLADEFANFETIKDIRQYIHDTN